MNAWLIVGIVALTNVTTGAFMYGAGGDACKARQVDIEDTLRSVQAAAQQGAASAIAAQQPINRTIVQKVQREIIETPVYRDCKHSPDGLRGVNAALTGRAEPAGGGELPGAQPAR